MKLKRNYKFCLMESGKGKKAHITGKGWFPLAPCNYARVSNVGYLDEIHESVVCRNCLREYRKREP